MKRPFSKIPSPVQLPLIKNLYLFLPGGKYKLERLTEAVRDLSRKYGCIFKLNFGALDMVCSTNADDAEKLFRNEGKYPRRTSFDALIHYRQKHFGSIGVIPGNGEEWYKFRSGILPLLRTNVVKSYEKRFEEVADSFVDYIDLNRGPDMVLKDVLSHSIKFAIDGISVVSPGHRFRCLNKNQLATDAIIKASTDLMDAMYKTLTSPPLWMFYKTSSYRKIESSHSYIYSIINKYLEDYKSLYEENAEEFKEMQPFMSALFDNRNLKWEDVVILAIETFLGGIDATATTISFTLHYLARNKQVQNKIRSNINEPSYLNACIKETLRLSPTAGANGRFLSKDTEMDGYLIPKGTLVSVFSSVTSTSDKYFKDPQIYNPERWLRTSPKQHHPFASLPFGYGARMCPGQRIAELQMSTLLKKVLLKYELESVDDYKVGMVYRLNRIPDKPINVKFLNTNC